MFKKLDEVVHRFDRLNEKLSNPEIYDNQDDFKKVSEERSTLEEIVETYTKYKQIVADINEAKKILLNEKDEELRSMAKDELSENEGAVVELENMLKFLLIPKDPLDEKNVMMEIRAGAGGDEASIFVADVLRMYQNYYRKIGLKGEIVSVSEGDEGIKEVILSVTGNKAYSRLKYESGVHRVQRIPKTESQGRVHTSTITVAVLPEADDIDFKLDLNEVRIDVFRASGAGGQHVNTTDSAVRLTHLPTGVTVSIQDEKSQHKNKDKAFKILKAKLYDMKVQEQQGKEAQARKELVGRGDRSERIRTYNYPQGRITDHRIGLTVYNLEDVINGDLSEFTDALMAHNQAILLKGEEEGIS